MMTQPDPMQLDFMTMSPAPTQECSQHQTMLAGKWIPYVVKRSRRRRGIALTIDENGLRVGATWRTSQHRIESLLAAHASWIIRKLADWDSRKPLPMSWQAGATIMVKGEPLRLAPVSRHGVSRCDGERLDIAVDADDPETLAKHVIAWLRETALEWFEQRTAYYAPVLGVRIPRIRLSNARTRWGVCHPAGRIGLNWRLIQMPPALIDYVVVHELAHLREPNHSPHFWRWVASVLPDHEIRRRTLRREGHHYLIA